MFDPCTCQWFLRGQELYELNVHQVARKRRRESFPLVGDACEGALPGAECDAVDAAHWGF